MTYQVCVCAVCVQLPSHGLIGNIMSHHIWLVNTLQYYKQPPKIDTNKTISSGFHSKTNPQKVTTKKKQNIFKFSMGLFPFNIRNSQNICKTNEPRKKPSYFQLYWLVNRDPYNGLLKSLYNPTNQGFFHCSNGCFFQLFFPIPGSPDSMAADLFISSGLRWLKKWRLRILRNFGATNMSTFLHISRTF